MNNLGDDVAPSQRRTLGAAFGPAQSASPAPPTGSTSMRLGDDVRDRLSQFRLKTGWTTATIIIAAIEQAGSVDELEEILYPGERVGGTFFAVRGTGSASTPRKQGSVFVRMNAEDLEVLDQLVDQTGARSRTHLVDAVLRHYLKEETHGNSE